MEKAKKVKRPVKKGWRERGWYEIFAPSMFGGVKIGESPTLDSGQLQNRVIDTTLGDLIEDFSKSHVKLYFQVRGLEGNRASTEFIGHDLAQDYVRSQIRRRITKVDGIFDVTTKDGYRLRVTPMAITFRRIQGTQIETVRACMREIVEGRSGKLTLDQFVQEAVLGKLASDIYKVIKKICPTRHVEIRKTKVIGAPTAA